MLLRNAIAVLSLSAMLLAGIAGCSDNSPRDAASSEAEARPLLLDGLSSGGMLSQRDRARWQLASALDELDSSQFQTHYDWDGTDRVTADWDIRPETQVGEPSFVILTVPKSVGEANVGAAAALAMRDSDLGPLKFWPDTLMAQLLPQAIKAGASASDGYRCWAWDCRMAADDAERWQFELEFKPVAEGFGRDEMDANVKPLQTTG